MGQLFDRMGRLIRSELNAHRGDPQCSDLEAGAALVAGGALTGASIGKVGLLAAGTGYSLGTVPLAAVGALTGAALYEALRSLIEADASSTGAAAMGAAAGTATSAAIGGVGVAAGGSAIGVGMATMAAGGAVVGLGLVGLNRLLQQGIDPEKLLDDAIEQMKVEAQNARQAVIKSMASQKRLQQQAEQSEAAVNQWQQRAWLALQEGNESLAKAALIQKKKHVGILSCLQAQLDHPPASIQQLKQNLTGLEAKIAEAKIMRTRLKVQIRAAWANGLLPTTSRTDSYAMSAFERMEEKVLQMEARAQAAAEWGAADLESQLSELGIGPGSDIDAELAAFKAVLLEDAHKSKSYLPGSSLPGTAPRCEAVNQELEELKSMLDQL